MAIICIYLYILVLYFFTWKMGYSLVL